MKKTGRLILALALCAAVALAFSCAPARAEGPAPGRPGGDQTPAQGGDRMPEQGAGRGVPLDVRWDPNHGTYGGYVLLINGRELEWEQDIGSAVSFFSRNGIPMETYENGNGHSGEQEIVFAQNIQLQNKYAVYADQGAGPAEGKLHTVRMYVAMGIESPYEAADKSQEVYEKLCAKFGTPRDMPGVYTGSSFMDAGTDSMYSAVIQMANSVEDNYAFAYADFKNLSLYAHYWEGKISIYLSLSII